MDIINYMEVDKLEEHLLNRRIQEALLDSDTLNWALNYDKKNLGKNIAIAYNLPVNEWEQYKTLSQLNTASATNLVKLAKISLGFANVFYSKILPYATVKKVRIYSNSTLPIASGKVILLKYDYSTATNGGSGRHGVLSINGRLDGDNNATNIGDGVGSTRSVGVYDSPTISRSGCACVFDYTFWYI